MVRKSGARLEAELYKRIGLSKQGDEPAIKLQNKSRPTVESDGTQADIEAWYRDKVKSLEGMKEDDLPAEMRRFLAFMRLKINRR